MVYSLGNGVPIVRGGSAFGPCFVMRYCNRKNPAQFENRIKPRVFVRLVTCRTMYEKVPFYFPGLAQEN